MAKRKSGQSRIKIRKEPEKNLEFYKEHKSEYESLVKRANARWKNIEKNELSSPAVEEAILARNGKHYFSVADFKGENALSELAALRTFLADETSTVQGAKFYTDTVVREKDFQSEWGRSWEIDPETGEKYNNYKKIFEETYGEEFTKRIYSNYRRIEDEYGDLLLSGVLGEQFDSETLITIMFSRAVESKKKYFWMRDAEGNLKLDNEGNRIIDFERAPEFNFAMKTMRKYDERIRATSDVFSNKTNRDATILYGKGIEFYDGAMGTGFFI